MRQAHGTVELDSPLNAPEDFPSAAYSPLELQLASLERVSPVPAQAAAIEGLAELYQCGHPLASQPTCV